MAQLSAIFAKINHYCRQNGLLEPASKVLIALSGGADSVFLFRYLISSGLEVEAAHCNFHLRGEESNRDEQFVRDLCSACQIKLHVQHFDTHNYAQTNHISIEMAARTLRYSWFEQLLIERHLDTLAVAHHRDDNTESMLLNLVRGTGIKGLCGMQPRNGHIVRPLLCISRADILTGLNEMQQSFVDDSTNFDNLFSRNRIRLDVLPLLRSINAGADINIATTIENLNEVLKVYEESIERCKSLCCEYANEGLSDENHTLYINKERLLSCTSPLSVLHEILAPFGFNRSQVQLILQCESTGKQFYSSSHRVVSDRNRLIVSPLTAETCDFNIPLESFPDIKTSIIDAECCTIQHLSTHAYFDADKVKGKLHVRPVKPGDRFRPFGMSGSKLVSDLLTDHKVNLIERSRQLVLCDEQDILWVIGRRASETCKVTPSTRRVLCCEWVSI